MVDKFVSPMVFALILVSLSWLSERNKSPDRKPDRRRMRFWIACWSLMACGEYALAWHKEIGLAWQNHPGLTLFGTLIVLGIFNAITPPLDDFLTTFPDAKPRSHSQARVL